MTQGLAFRDIRKAYGAVHALDGVSFDVAEGEAHAIVGENGAGKSTLLKILGGLVRADAGEILWRGAPFAPSSPRDALDRGLGIVHQEMLAFPNLSVTANIFAGRELTARGWLLETAMRNRARALLDRLRLTIDPDAAAESLSTAHRQLLQVARALAFECRILVLDEPTTALTGVEVEHLFSVLEDLRQRGTTLIYVSHRLPEVFRLCDRITVLRDGKFVATHERRTASPDEVVRSMVGRNMKAHDRSPRKPPEPERAKADLSRRSSPEPERAKADLRLEVRGLTRRPCFHDVSLCVARGEIVGVFGIVGSGRSELLETIFGIHRPDAGEVIVDGSRLRARSARDAARAGIALVPEERQRQGLFFNLDVLNNLMSARRTVGRDLMIHARDERAAGGALVEAWRIKLPSLSATPDRLSGGNQQKVVAARWLATSPRVLLLDEPTKGVDVGAKFEIHDLIRQQAGRGMAVLVVSSDLPELLVLADRVIVMRAGVVQGELSADAATEESVMRLATAQRSRAVPELRGSEIPGFGAQ